MSTLDPSSDDRLRAARGIVLSVIFGSLLWTVIIAALIALF